MFERLNRKERKIVGPGGRKRFKYDPEGGLGGGGYSREDRERRKAK